MKNKIFFSIFFIMMIIGSAAYAGSPNYVDSNNTGTFYRWKDGRINVWFDPGGLTDTMGHVEARNTVIDAWMIWEDAQLPRLHLEDKVYVTGVDFVYRGTEKVDINETNYMKYFFRDQGASDPNRHTVIIFDKDGTIMEDLVARGYLPAGAEDNVLGITDIYAKDVTNKYILNATIILNGRKFATSQGEAVMKAAALHEWGHALNMDHSAVNSECYDDKDCSGIVGKGWEYLPTMYKWALTPKQEALTHDDIATLAYMYNFMTPNSNILNEFCLVRGKVYDVENRGFQGAQITARELNNEYMVAMSAVSGSFFSACAIDDADADLNAGEYVIAGLRPGQTYVLEVHSIPNFCTGLDPGECGLGSGINPYAPPRSLHGEEIYVTNEGVHELNCEEGGQVFEVDDVVLSADLDSDEYKYYDFDGVEFECVPGEGQVIVSVEEPVSGEAGGSGKLFAKGWCALVPDSPIGPGFLSVLLLLVPFILIRRKSNPFHLHLRQ